MKIESELKLRSTAELAEQVKKDLETPDPSPEKVTAILNEKRTAAANPNDRDKTT